MKRVISLVLCLIIIFCLTACSSNNNLDATENNSSYDKATITQMMEEGSYAEASKILKEHPEIEDNSNLLSQCGYGALIKYIQEKGVESDGKLLLSLVNKGGKQFNLAYIPANDTFEFIYIEQSFGIAEMIDATLENNGTQIDFIRSTIDNGTPKNYQEGYIVLREYTGSFSGGIADNSVTPLDIFGLHITDAQTVYSNQTRGYHLATLSYFNEMTNLLSETLQKADFAGTLQDIGFEVYNEEN